MIVDMKSLLFVGLVLAHTFTATVSAQAVKSVSRPTATYKNPLPVQFGDPYVLQTNGLYYMYGTGGGAEKGFAAYSSTDLVNWKPEGQVYFHDNTI